MKKELIIFLVLFTSITSSYAQRNLQVKEKTEGISVFTEKQTEVINAGGAQAGAVISCPLTLNLSFSSNVDKTVDVWKIEVRGELRFYYLRFIVGRFKGASYDGRVLEVTAAGFLPNKFRLNLAPGESKSFEVFDPNATVGVGCFYQNFNEGVELFRKSLYIEAKEKYRTSLECNDIPAEVSVYDRIMLIDSILLWRHRADSCFEAQNFKEAINFYQKITSQNREDFNANTRHSESLYRRSDLCSRYFNSAEEYFANGDFQEAKKLYAIVTDQQCMQAEKADARLVEIRIYERERLQGPTVICYEIAKNTPIGLSIGLYKLKKIRGYVSVRTNGDFFRSLQTDASDVKKSELNASAGLTFGIYSPVWLFMGCGYTEVGKSGDITVDFVAHRAISPEIGVLGKIGPIALRYTFQYRFAFEKDYQDFIRKFGHVIGVGYCF